MQHKAPEISSSGVFFILLFDLGEDVVLSILLIVVMHAGHCHCHCHEDVQLQFDGTTTWPSST